MSRDPAEGFTNFQFNVPTAEACSKSPLKLAMGKYLMTGFDPVNVYVKLDPASVIAKN